MNRPLTTFRVTRGHLGTGAVVLVVLALAVILGQRAASDAASGERVLHGRVVVDDHDATALHRARVTADVDGSERAVAFTSPAGTFELRVPAATAYTLRVAKAGFATRTFRRTADHPVAPVLVALPRGAAVSGRVRDSFGDPAIVPIVLRADPRPGDEDPEDRLVMSDDRGAFRFGSLAAGRYEIYLEGAPARLPGTDLTVHSTHGATARAAAVHLSAGETVDVDLTYHPPAGTYTLAVRPGHDIEHIANDSPAGSGRGTIAGRVHQLDGSPVGGASILLEPVGDGRGQTVLSGPDGRFMFTRVQPGGFHIIAVKSGYLATQYGWQSIPQHGRPVTLRANQSLHGIDIALSRAAAISGTVRDAFGEPLEGLELRAWQVRFDDGRLRLAPAAAERAGRSDDRGHYRLHGLAPGTYYVAVADDAQRDVDGHPPRLYYPGRLLPSEAMPITVDVGVSAEGADIVFDGSLWHALPSIEGRMVDGAGEPLAGTAVLSMRHRSGTVGLPPRTTAVTDDGRFTFDSVPPGEYVVHVVQYGLPAFPRAFGREFVTVAAGEPATVVITALHGTTVTGRIVLDGNNDGVQPSNFRIAVGAADVDQVPPFPELQPWAIMTRDDVTFEVGGLSGHIRFVTDRAPDGWWLQSVAIGGANAARVPVAFGSDMSVHTDMPSDVDVAIVFSDTAGSVAGRVVNSRGQPEHDARIVVFTTDPTGWFVRSAAVVAIRSDPDGRFEVRSLPPGEYWVAALDTTAEATSGQPWQQPASLDRLIPYARRVVIEERQAVTLELSITPFRQ